MIIWPVNRKKVIDEMVTNYHTKLLGMSDVELLKELRTCINSLNCPISAAQADSLIFGLYSYYSNMLEHKTDEELNQAYRDAGLS